ALALDLCANLAARLPPALEIALATVSLRDLQQPVERDPGHHLRIHEVSRLAADLPDALVGLLPLVEHGAAGTTQEIPEDVVDLAPVLAVEPGRVEELAEHVELELGGGSVADPHRPRPPIPLEMVELDLGQEALAADSIHDLERVGAAGSRPPQP